MADRLLGGMSWLSWLSTFILFVLALLLVGVRVFGLTPYAVVSGSMMPDYGVGDLVYVRSVPLASIEVGIPITYVFDSSLLVVTHRVVEVDHDSGLLTTKGDANDNVDSVQVHYLNVCGVVVGSLPLLGFVSLFVGSRWGVGLLCVLMGLMLVRRLFDFDA